MDDTHKSLANALDTAHHGEVESLATQVLSALAQRSGQSGQALDEVLLANFCADLLRPGTTIKTHTVADLRRQGVSVGAIVDGYIPAAAREMGERWCRDELSFADVTIGAARLQAMLRDLGASWTHSPDSNVDAPNVMLIVPLDEFHTLGGMTAATQMRRMGVSVCVCLGQGEDEIQQKVASRQFDMIAISACTRDRLDSIRKLVMAIRNSATQPVPIVIGGLVVESGADICALTGADHACNEPAEALQLCGVAVPATGAPDRAGRA